MENKDFVSFIEKINDIEIYDEESFDIKYIDNSNNKQSILIQNEDVSFAYQLKLKQYEFKLKKPLFISSIDIKSKNNDLNGTMIEAFDYFTNEIIKRTIQSDDNNYLSISFNRIITSFTIKPLNKKDKVELTLIELNGFELDKSSIVIESFKKHSVIKKELEKLYANYLKELTDKEEKIKQLEVETNATLTVLKNDIAANEIAYSNSNENLVSLKAEIKTNSLKLDELNTSFEIVENTKNDLEEKSKNLKKDISERESELKILTSKVVTTKLELKRLNEDKTLMAYELKGFVTEANTNIVIYLIVGLVLIATIIALTIYLFNGAANLTEINLSVLAPIGDNNTTVTDKITPNHVGILDIIFSRVPFVIIVTTIIISLYELAKIFIQKSMNIQNQKMNLSKIGIVSKDVSDTSSDGFNLSSEELYEYRTKLKMDILKEYLKKDIDMEFDYKINQNILDKVKNYISIPKKEE